MAVLSTKFKLVDEMSARLKEIGTAGREVSEQLQNIGTTGQYFNGVSSEAENLTATISSTSNVLTEFSDIQLSTVQNSESLADSIGINSAELSEYSDKANSSSAATEDLQDKLSGTQQEYQKTQEETARATEKTEEYGSTNKKVFGELEGLIASVGIVAFLKQVYDGYQKCIESASEYETSVAKVSTLADPNQMSVGDMSSELLELSQKTGQAASELAEAEYQALSAGVATKSAADFVEQANKLAVGGFTESATAVDVLTTALNAYQLNVSETNRVSDTLIMTQNLGKTTVDELAQNMGRVIPAAAAYNVEIEDLSTAYAILTANGIATAESTTNIKGMLNELGDTGSDVSEILNEKTGKTFAQLQEEGKSLGDVIGILSASVDGNTTAFANLWSSQEAGLGALSLLTSGTEKYNSTLDKMKNSAGTATEAYQKMTDTTEYTSKALQNAGTNFQIAVGNAMLPATNKFNEALTNVLNGLTTFVNEHPGAVRATSAIAIGIGALTAAVTLYSAKTKIATVATVAFKAAKEALAGPSGVLIGLLTAGVTALALWATAEDDAAERANELTTASQKQQEAVEAASIEYENACKKFGETSPYVDEYRTKLDELTTSFNQNKTTVGDLILKNEELATKYKELHDSDKTEQINNEAAATKTLSDRLFELAGKTNLTSGENVEMLSIIQQLNKAFPELNLNYNDVLSKTATTKEALLDLVNQEYEQERYDNAVDKYKESLALKAEAEENYYKLLDEIAPYSKKYGESDGNAQAYAEYESFMNSMIEVTDESGNTIKKSYREAFDEASQKVKDLTTDVESYKSAMLEAKGITEEAADIQLTEQDAINAAADGINIQLYELATAYDEAYNAALSSFQNQFALWDEAPAIVEASTTETNGIVAMSVSTLSENLDTQIKYWETYNSNLENLKGRNIEGLNELVASMDDGSEQSAAALAGMATASDSELQKMVDKFTALQGEQKNTADSVGKLKTGFNDDMDDMLKKAQDTIDGMNLSEEATASARATMNSYINEIRNADIAGAVQAKIEEAQKSFNITVTSTPTTTKGYAVGTSSAAPGLALVGENGPELVNFGGGEVVYTASETESILNQSFNIPDIRPNQINIAPYNSEYKGFSGSSEKVVTLKLEGLGSIRLSGSGGVSKSEVIDILTEQIKPVLVSVLSDEIYEEGEDSYDY